MKSIRNSAIAALVAAFLLLAFADSRAQRLRIVAETETFTDYQLSNDKLSITPPDYLIVPWENNQARYRILEQEVVPVPVDSSTIHFAEQPDQFLLSTTETPVITVGEQGYTRGRVVVPITIHLARLQQTGNPVFQVTRNLKIRVYKPETPSLRQTKTASLSFDAPLASGQWYKIPLEEDHLYQINSDYLSDLGVQVDNIDPRNIQIWTTDGYELSRLNSDPRSVLTQIPIIVEGEENGSFDDDDRVLFVGNSPHSVFFDEQSQRWQHKLHPYSNKNYVFLTIGNEAGLRMEMQPLDGRPTSIINEFEDFLWQEVELEKPEARFKSGTQWLGRALTPGNPTLNIFTDTIPGHIPDSEIHLEISMAARSTALSRFNLTLNGYSGIPDLSVSAIGSYSDATGNAARMNTLSHTINGLHIDDDILRLQATLSTVNSQARAWVNWVRIRAHRTLTANNNKLLFHPPRDAFGPRAAYNLNGFSHAPFIFDVTDPVQPIWLESILNNDYYTIHASTDPSRRFLAVSDPKTPAAGSSVPNQDLRNPGVYPDYVIITSETLREEAMILAEHRQNGDGLTPVVVTQSQIFNEFSGGVPDVTALRDYVKFLYDRGALYQQQQPMYLLLFGNTTFDYKGIMGNTPMQNHVFTFQSEESLVRERSYASDDFFTFMGESEGLWISNDATHIPDLAVGRIPVQTPEDASMIIEKIKRYEDPRNQGDWQTLFTFIADDDIASRRNDRDLHILNANGTADVIDRDATGIRIDKIYQISYPAVNTGSGLRVPEATNAMIDRINNGTLLFNFSGHGSEQFLTDQRLFTADDIPRLNNRDRLSIMITATCSFGRYDDSDDYSGAEKLLLHPDGGIIATYTTSRVAYTSPSPTDLSFGLNIQLTREITKRDENNRPLRIGDIYRNTKMTPVGQRFNSRMFTLLGDPAMRIGLPESQARVTHINDTLLDDQEEILNIRSLDQVTVQGHILRPDSTIDRSFSGEANVRVFDASRLVRYPEKEWVVAQNCFLSDCGYHVQSDMLFNGRVSVTDGEFQSTFVIPKDVSYSEQTGQVHVYAHERNLSATGATSGFRIQGQNPDATDNQRGPDIEIYLNDELFIDGGIVNDSPKLIVLLSDDYGINTTGAGVGHEIVAIIEDFDAPENRKTIPLNEYYQSNLDDFSSGRIEYPLDGLEEDSYRLRIRAWDVFNNMGESEISFQVLDSKDLQLRNVFNYPNPMHNFTSFVFEHNQPGTPLDIRIRIFTPSGQPVTTIRRDQYITSGNMVKIDWFGRDEDMHRLATGTYLYHLQVAAQTGNGRQVKDKIERLVILR
ncbi:type IX secretion system sortase PorU [Balneolaceae bacterium ANBcel3]|nr:type IX secretion system sortase PorU [Balneolaceae bacterium ANBcel3]